MNILDEIDEEMDARKRVACHTCIWLLSRPDEERPQWEAALEKKSGRTSMAILAVMAKRSDDPPTEHSIQYHRRGHR